MADSCLHVSTIAQNSAETYNMVNTAEQALPLTDITSLICIMRLRFHIVHALQSNPMRSLQVSTWLMGQDHAAVPLACQSRDTEFDWFTFSERLSGQTALCLLIPVQGATLILK